MIIGTRSLDTAVSESDVRLLDVPTVLLRFLAIVTESGRVCSSLDTLELCYSMTATAAGEAQLVPVWRIGHGRGRLLHKRRHRARRRASCERWKALLEFGRKMWYNTMIGTTA